MTHDVQTPIRQIIKEVGMGSGCSPYKSFGSPVAGPILMLPLLSHLTPVGQGQWGAGEVIDAGA